MGFFDRFSAKKPAVPKPAPAPVPVPVPEPAEEKKPVAGSVLPQLSAAREKLKTKDLAGAMALYEEVLVGAADRADVLVTISGDLGAAGHVQQLIELIAPRYDAQKHGAAAGINLLQAYLSTRNAEAAQHLLDLLFSLQRPDLEARLVGFSNAIAEMFVAETEAGEVALPRSEAAISMASISKPIWFYGLEEAAPHLLPPKEGRLRRVAFAQCALPGLADAATRAVQPEDALGRLSRGLPLWFSETFAFGAGYSTFAAVAGTDRKHYALLLSDWSAENVRQLHDTTEGGLDYVVTSALRNRNDDFELALRIWEVRKYRELKAFAVRWTPATADAELRKFHEQVRGYMEWKELPAGHGLAYAAPAAPLAHAHALGSSLGFFLCEKGVLAPEQAPPDTAVILHSARANPADARAQLTLVTALLRLRARGTAPEAAAVEHARAWLASEAARAIGVAEIALG